jgi:hypothetical protein
MRRHMPKRCPAADPQRHLDLLPQLVRARAVRLVDHEEIGRFHDAGLEGLDAVARFRNQDQDRAVGHAGDVELALTHSDRLHQNPVEACRVEQVGDLARGGGQPAKRAPAGHAPDVDALVEGDGLHADAVAQQGAAGEGAGGIHRDDADLMPLGTVGADEALQQRGLAGAGRAGDADAPGSAERGVHSRQESLEAGARVFDHRDRPREGRRLAGQELREQEVGIHA